MQNEITKITNFIKDNLLPSQNVVIGVSGGLDSDVVTRLVHNALGKERIKLYIVLQSDMDKNHVRNARDLAKSLDVKLIEINLEDIPFTLVTQVEKVDTKENFNSNGLLDTARTKVALRTVVNSMYQDKGYVVIGASNKTEIELGFFLPFGDGVAHLKPIAHLYKTSVCKLAKLLRTHERVLNQPPSAGLWKGQTDLEDISYWIYNESPIQEEIEFTESDLRSVEEIYSKLSIKKIDLALSMIKKEISLKTIAEEIDLDEYIIIKIDKLVRNSKLVKLQPMNVQLTE